MFYWVKTPSLIKQIFPSLIWEQAVTNTNKHLYLTFDDGPTPIVTEWVLAQLAEYQAKATFFCLGKNTVQYPDIFQQIIAQQHSIGNHTFHHLNGWKTTSAKYITDVNACTKVLPTTTLFRPPYGRISYKQARLLQQAHFKIVMWSILSGDFDQNLDRNRCLQQTRQAIYPGAILVFHDSQKAFQKLRHVLPAILSYCHQQAYQFKSLPML